MPLPNFIDIHLIQWFRASEIQPQTDESVFMRMPGEYLIGHYDGRWWIDDSTQSYVIDRPPTYWAKIHGPEDPETT